MRGFAGERPMSIPYIASWSGLVLSALVVVYICVAA
jgi:hypothetical protein